MDLSLSPLRAMQPAIVERLREAFPARTFTIERVPAMLTLAEFKRVIQLSPFIGLSWTGLTPDRRNAREIEARWGWALTLIYKASGSPDRRFAGDALGLGLDAMFDVAVALLQGAEIPRVGACHVTGAESAYAEGWEDADTVVARIAFEVATKTAPVAFRLRTADDFSRLGVAWLIGDEADPTAPAKQPSVQSDITIGDPA